MLTLLLAACITLDVTRELLFKKSAMTERGPGAAGIAAAASTGWATAGAIVWGIEILLWAAVLAELPLNIAFPIMSLTYAVTPLAGAVVFGEKVSLNRWLGIALVTTGVMVVGSTGKV